MPILANARHERFAQELARGRSCTEAYKEAGYDCEGSSAWSSASRLSRNVEVSARVRELQQLGADKAVLTEEWVISRLMQNAERAMQAEPVIGGDGEAKGEFKYEGNVANRALELLGKKLGIFVEKVDLNATHSGLGDDDLDARIAAAAVAAGVAGDHTEH